MRTITAYKCYLCGKLDGNDWSAKNHFEFHAKERLANYLLRKGRTLEEINNKCKFCWQLSEKHKLITENNCFIISYLQCCEEPAYQITFISGGGKIRVFGVGSWSGGYASYVGFHCLENPRPSEELYKDKRNL